MHGLPRRGQSRAWEDIVTFGLFGRMTLALCAGSFVLGAPAFADTISINPRVIPIGKWAAGLARDGNTMWVAESGQRTIAQVDPIQGVIRRVQVGALPVNMVSFNGAVYALVQTAKIVWQQMSSSAQGRALAQIDGCPQDMAAGGQNLWVLFEPNCTDAQDRLMRLDPKTNERRIVDLPLGKGRAVSFGGGKAWVVRDRDSQALSAVDEQSLAVRNVDIKGTGLLALSAGDARVYVGGRLGADGPQGVVVAVDPGSMQEVRRQVVNAPVVAITYDAQNVVATDLDGRIYVFSAGDLQLLRTINLPAGTFVQDNDGGGPGALLLIGDTLYVSNFHQVGTANGSILALTGWRPAAMPVAPQSAPQPAQPAPAPSAPIAGATDCPYQVIAAADSTGIWMYQDPDTSAPKVVAVPSDSKGLVADRCLTTWCHVTFRGSSGWVQREHIKAICN